MISVIIESIFQWLSGIIINPISELIDGAMSNLNNASGVVSNTDFKALLGSAISLFIPVKAIYQCLGYIIPIKIINLVVSIVIRIKSFIPSMGGK